MENKHYEVEELKKEKIHPTVFFPLPFLEMVDFLL